MRAMIVLLLALGLCGQVRAQAAVSEADHGEIRSVITRQLEAFRQDDASGAFGFAAPNIQSMFGNPDTFIEMVRRGYPPVYRSRAADFGALTQDDAGIVQDVDLIGPDGLTYTARYSMERQPDGSWRISGCQLVESKRLGV